jgi:hypothetical protein
MSIAGEVCAAGRDAAVGMVRATIAAPSTKPVVMVKYANFFMAISIGLSWILSMEEEIGCLLFEEPFGLVDENQVFQDKPAEFGERARPLTAVEYATAKFGFETLKCSGQRWLRDAALAGGARERAFSADGEEVVDLTHFHGNTRGSIIRRARARERDRHLQRLQLDDDVSRPLGRLRLN